MNSTLYPKFTLTALAFAALGICAPAHAAHKRALLVGVHAYAYAHGTTGPFVDLGAQADIDLIRKTLIDKYGFAPADIVTLTTPTQTTKASILRNFRSVLIDKTHPGDILYFHFSGYGSQVADIDDPSGVDQTFVPSDWTADGSTDIREPVVDGLIADAVGKHPATFLLTFDAAHTGSGPGVGRGVDFEARFGHPPVKAPMRSMRGARMMLRGARMMLRGGGPKHGFVRIDACQDGQTDIETQNAGHPVGRLSLLLAQALRKAAPTATYRDIFDQIDIAMRHGHPSQNPVIDGDLDSKVFNGAGTNKT